MLINGSPTRSSNSHILYVFWLVSKVSLKNVQNPGESHNYFAGLRFANCLFAFISLNLPKSTFNQVRFSSIFSYQGIVSVISVKSLSLARCI